MICLKQKVTKSARKVTKSKKKAKDYPTVKEEKKCQKAVFHSIGATIRTGQERRCLPYAGFSPTP